MVLIGEWAGKGEAECRAELGYDRGLDRARAGLGYTRRFNKLHLTGFGEVASDGSVAASRALAFSFGQQSNGGRRVSAEKIASPWQHRKHVVLGQIRVEILDFVVTRHHKKKQ